MILRLLRRDVEHTRERVRRLQRRDDALESAAELERSHRLIVRRRQKFDTAHVVEPGVLGPDTRIIKSRRNRMRLFDLAVLIHQQIGPIAVQHARPAAGDRCGVLAAVKPVTGGLNAIDFDPRLVEEGMEPVSYTHLRAHETDSYLVCRLLLEKK